MRPSLALRNRAGKSNQTSNQLSPILAASKNRRRVMTTTLRGKPQVSNVSLASGRRILAAALALSVVTSTFIACPSADAFWPFNKKKDHAKTVKKKRQLAATQVGLVPGNPPALIGRPRSRHQRRWYY